MRIPPPVHEYVVKLHKAERSQVLVYNGAAAPDLHTVITCIVRR